MKTMILSIFLLSSFDFCFGQIKVNEMDRQRAKKTDIMHFFSCMTGNNHLEKIAKNNYYIFDTINGKLYYGKVNSGLLKGKITEVFKVDVGELCKKIPNYKNLNGTKLKEIVLSDILKTNGLCNKSEIIVNNISFKLEMSIIVSVDFVIKGQKQQKTYKLDASDFSIITEENLLLNATEGAYLNKIFETARNGFDFTNKKAGFIMISGEKGKTHYFDMHKKHSTNANDSCDNGTLYIFNAEQKAASGGYDAAIVYWSKFAVPVGQVIKRLKNKH
jgi:hypothetical protein